MPSKEYAGKDEPGYVSSMQVRPPIGGYVVCYDLEKGAFGGKLDPSFGRWVLVHRPGKKYVQFKTRDLARTAMSEIAKLVKSYLLFVIPKNNTGVPPLEVPAAAPPEGKKSRVRVREAAAPPPEKPLQTSPAASEPPEGKPSETTAPEQPPAGDFHLEFKRLMQQRFTPLKIVGEIEALLSATRTVATKEEVFEVPDYHARERGIRMAIEYSEGKATERPDVKEVKKMSWGELVTLFKRSPAARRAVRQIIEDEEAAASKAIPKPEVGK